MLKNSEILKLKAAEFSKINEIEIYKDIFDFDAFKGSNIIDSHKLKIEI